MELRRMTDEEIALALNALPDWTHRDGKLHRTVRLPSFPDAVAFVTRVAFEAERLDHHPEWSNVYDTVRIALVTHDVSGISERDVALATAIDAILNRADR